ncbi:MAG: ABC transporter ATP-binding protein/permease [candidate division Zixibacteria bacterium]|nr:ABC transporter ATP-binding protein/permease [candidate division Zixibacteria bacterium]MDH3936313.1 ABC transporter ATP-binding protein/permease [candidate division Zixibacteria bacterium]MDH4032888.1 ABC transporter ATP-binding protein/permease [candidate division Zixibacteria bacterium]
MTAEFYEDEKATAEEKDIGSKKAFGRLLPLLKEHTKGLLFCLGLLAGATLLSIYWPILIKTAVDTDIKSGDFDGLLWTALAIGGLQVATILFQYIQRIRLETIGQDVMVALKRKLYHHILSLDVSFFDKNPVGRLLARVESDTEALRMLFTNTVVLVVGDFLLVAGIYAVMFYYSWRLASLLLIVVPIVALLVVIFERKTTKRFLNVRKKMAEVTATLTEFLHGMSIVQIFHRGAYAQQRVSTANREKFAEDTYVNIAVVLFFNTVFFFESVMLALVLFFGDQWRQAHLITSGTFIMFIVLIWKSFEPIWRVSEQLSTIQKAVAGAKRIFALLSTPQRLLDPANPVRLTGLKKSIRFEKVWFSYTDDDNYALKDVSFEIPVGKRFALVGVTGGGKSTVISLLLRLYDPQKGRITIDGVDIRDIRKADLRGQFALVLQDIFLFPGDVTSNISLDSDEMEAATIEDAARTVEADRFIDKLPDKYGTEVSEKGSNFSRGERQLLSFARALASEPDILLLDEATSSVDPETERTIQSSLKKLMADRTSIIVAHRLSTILDVDQILVIRRGEIIERGSHTELLLQDGYYSKLFHLQFKHRNGVLADAG